MIWIQRDEQEQYKTIQKHYNDASDPYKTLLNDQEWRMWVEKPCDPLQDLHHPKHNALFVVQKSQYLT